MPLPTALNQQILQLPHPSGTITLKFMVYTGVGLNSPFISTLVFLWSLAKQTTYTRILASGLLLGTQTKMKRRKYLEQ